MTGGGLAVRAAGPRLRLGGRGVATIHRTAMPVRIAQWLLLLCLPLLLVWAGVAAAQDLVPIPRQTARVMDTAKMLSAEQRAALEEQLAGYEAAKGTQIAVLTIPSTAPEVIEQFGIRVAEAWKTGRKGVSDGAILIVAPDNPRELRRLRIEVGYGLEGAIPDVLAARIINEEIAPRFREKDYYGGLKAALDRMRAVLEKEELPPVESADGALFEGFPVFFVVLFFFLIVIFNIWRRVRGLRYINGRGNARAAAAGGLLGGLLSNSGRRGGRWSSSSDWGSSSWGSSSSSSSSDFGGGGGGDFGGGGASGDW